MSFKFNHFAHNYLVYQSIKQNIVFYIKLYDEKKIN